MAELYVVRSELEGLAARLAAQHATEEEVRVLRRMIDDDKGLLEDPAALSRANRRFHRQVHLASHNRYLVQQLDLVYRSMALMATTSLSAVGRGEAGAGRAHRDRPTRSRGVTEKRPTRPLKAHISKAFETRLERDAERGA